jgi:hypothetical protein
MPLTNCQLPRLILLGLGNPLNMESGDLITVVFLLVYLFTYRKTGLEVTKTRHYL